MSDFSDNRFYREAPKVSGEDGCPCGHTCEHGPHENELSHAPERPWTADRREGRVTVATVKRCCNGCGRQLGDVLESEMEAAIQGFPLPDVRAECGCI